MLKSCSAWTQNKKHSLKLVCNTKCCNFSSSTCFCLPAGYSNTGKKPEAALARIRSLLGYSTTQPDHTHEKMLGSITRVNIYIKHVIGKIHQNWNFLSDIYVFGVGDQVNKDELNLLASNKREEHHYFNLKTYGTLGKMFNSIISE